MSDFTSDVTRPVAKKAHRCDVCQVQIQAGTRYARGSGRYDGAFFTCAVHGPCRAAANEAYSGWDGGLMQLHDYNADEALDVYHAAGVLAEALPILRQVRYIAEALDGQEDAAILARYDAQAAEQLERDRERIARHFGHYGLPFDRLDARLRDVAVKRGIWAGGALTAEGEALVAPLRPVPSYPAAHV